MFWNWFHKLKMILKNENDFEKLKWIWKTKMISKNENEFEKWKWTWKMKMNLNIHTISGVRYDTTLLYPQLSPDAIATPRQPTSHWWLCRWFQPARPSAIMSALAGRCWPPLPPQRPPLKSLSTAGRVLPYTKIDYTIQREKFHVPAVNDTQPTQQRWRRNGRMGGFHLRKVPVTPRYDVLAKFSSFH